MSSRSFICPALQLHRITPLFLSLHSSHTAASLLAQFSLPLPFTSLSPLLSCFPSPLPPSRNLCGLGECLSRSHGGAQLMRIQQLCLFHDIFPSLDAKIHASMFPRALPAGTMMSSPSRSLHFRRATIYTASSFHGNLPHASSVLLVLPHLHLFPLFSHFCTLISTWTFTTTQFPCSLLIQSHFVHLFSILIH